MDFDLLNQKSGIEKALSCKVSKKWVLTVSWFKKKVILMFCSGEKWATCRNFG